MKRTHIFSAAMSAAILVPILFFSSCQQREMELPDSETVPDVVIRARIEDPLTRTVLSGNDVSGYDVVWENGDEIVVTDAGGRKGTFATTDSGTKEAAFTLVSGYEGKTGPYQAWSPATLYQDGTPALPATRSYLAGNISGAPMFAESASDELTFKNICGLIRLKIDTDLPDVQIARISLGADQGLSGAITNAATLAADGFVAAVATGGDLQMDCGSEGVAIGQTPTSFYFAVPANTYTGLTITAATTQGVKQTWTLKSDRNVVVGRSLITDVSLSFTREFHAVDLSAKATANTYIVSEAGSYKFKATVKGNGGLDPMTGAMATPIDPTDIAGVKVLWELDSRGRTIHYDGSAYECFYAGGYVYFNTPETFATGVICVAVYDSSDNILWSWNIWSTPAPQTTVHNGKVFMDRNLCSVDVNGSRGFLYQWGRKDAFSAATGGYSSFPFVPALSTAFQTVTGIQTMAYTIAHPTTHINNGDANSWMSQTEYEKRPWRDDVKTIYDPSPAGWRVPTDADQNGMSGLPATGFSNAVNEFGNPSSGYYRTSTISSYPKAYAYRQNGERNDWGTNPAFAIRCVEDESASVDLSDYTDLSATATANSYVVPAAGSYRFRADVKGNGAASLAGVNKDTDASAIASAELLWASYGTATAPTATEMIRKIGYQDGYVFFSTGLDGFREGNAVVAVKDAGGTILWSWHLWFTDDDLESAAQTYPGGAVFMDRNLGAFDAIQSPDNYGLLYQWGRKDPFLASKMIPSGDIISTGGPYWRPNVRGTTHALVDKGENLDALADVVATPNSFVFQSSGIGGKWASDIPASGGLWAENKTIFDPCPPGWKIPSSGHWDTEFRNILISQAATEPMEIQTSTAKIVLPYSGIRATRVVTRTYNSSTTEYMIRFAGEVVKPSDYHYRFWGADGALVKDVSFTNLKTDGVVDYADLYARQPQYNLYYNSQYQNYYLPVIVPASGCSVRCVREDSPLVPVTSFTIPAAATVDQYGYRRLSVTTTPAQCSYYELNWTSSNTSIARVDAAGVVVGVSPGSCTVTATVPGIGSASCTVTVQASFPATVTAVDMGLPSGTLWADRNVGASSPAGTGTTGSWYSSSNIVENAYGSDSPWQVPTSAQCGELVANCTVLAMPSGVVAVSKINGNSLYFPDGSCWSSDYQYSGQYQYFYYLYVFSGTPYMTVSAISSSSYNTLYPVRAVQ